MCRFDSVRLARLWREDTSAGGACKYVTHLELQRRTVARFVIRRK